MVSQRMKSGDSFEREVDEWVDAIPGEVDAATEAVRQRIGRIARQFERVLADVAEDYEMSAGDWEALSVLARGPGDDGLTPGELGRVLGLTSGTVSVRVDRLASSGLVERTNGTDRRQRPVRLTERGHAAWGRATVTRTSTESAILRDCLSEKEIDTLGSLLGTLLARLETEYGPAPRHDMTRGRSARR
ncbi:MarR family transcriptional regulator [Flexivirga endophytica]|uniref:MarR family transcriptional regulator n=2 Tax=Flexivirga endophytica TaxID=1849103 RepID=A0A916TAJ9_9MICO|nr:MarR family transcriptional regulator [Flexivirga endophytica]GHB43953.1 MarR family transcriptional regulator [Flexivirga endophytica]